MAGDAGDRNLEMVEQTERVFGQECEAYSEAIRLFAEGRLHVEGRRVRVKAP